MNPNAWRTETGESIWEPHVTPNVMRRQFVDQQPRAPSPQAARRRPLESATTDGGTIVYGDIAVQVFERPWQGKTELYRYVTHLKPGERWHDAKLSSDPRNPATERVRATFRRSVPPGALAARELLSEGASLAVWTDTWTGRAVFMSPDLICVELTGELWDILQKIKATTGNRWSGLPDAIAVFPDGRIVMRDMKFAGKDKLTQTQHACFPVASNSG